MILPISSLAEDTEILDLDLSSLMEIQITSAGRKEQKLADVPAAVYVIDQEDIRNSGATSIPELLRLVPGLQVARTGSGKWAVASRGFNGTFSNKLLVQMDGRSVYNPAYSGVYWDMQTVMLEDIERIEVIRGPGATLWGANAVNGIINIMTKQASDTLGVLVSGTAGDHEDGTATLRYGRQLSNNFYGRIYINHHAEDSYKYYDDESDAYDDWGTTSGGFRLDSDVGLKNSWTLQGDLYDGKAHQHIFPYWVEGSPVPLTADDTIDTRGWNLTGRWQHNYNETNSWTLQAYFDYTDRQELYIGQTHKSIDLDFQHRFQLMTRHDIVWGLGFKNIDDSFNNTYTASILPDKRKNELFSEFIQDEINLISEKLWLTLGAKVEHNEYTEIELQPSARLLWKPEINQSLWASVSRAVRTPSRAEDSSRVVMGIVPAPPYPEIYINGNAGLNAEEVVAWEAGYRYSHDSSFSIDLAMFYNDYKELINVIASPSDPTNLSFSNTMAGNTYGLEINSEWKPLDWLKTELNYTYIELQMKDNQYGQTSSEPVIENSSPQHQVSLRTAIDLNKNTRLNIFARYVDELKIPSGAASRDGIKVDDYLALDTNIIWSPIENFEVMLAGQNLTDSKHLEFVNEYNTPATEIERSIYLKLTWKL